MSRCVRWVIGSSIDRASRRLARGANDLPGCFVSPGLFAGPQWHCANRRASRMFEGIDQGVKLFRPCLLSLVIAGILLPSWARGHGDVHERIVALSQEISRRTNDATLYLQRGELYRVHRDWALALADYDRAGQLDPALARIDVCRGRLWLESDQPKAAIVPLNRYLAKQTNDVEAFALRARARARLGASREAARDFERAVALTPVGSPELYIEGAEALAAAGAKEEAIRLLDRGIRRMGPLVTLQLSAIDLELSLGRSAAALARVDAVTAKMQRKESWLVRRARILTEAGQTAEAREAYMAALRAIEKLPPSHRRTRATLELEAGIRSALQE